MDRLLFPADIPEDKAGWLSFRQSTVINLFKGATPLFILYMIFTYQAHGNPVAWVYFGVHGCYGLLWVGKSLFGFEDLRFSTRKPLWYNMFTSVALLLYWIPIYLIVHQSEHERAPLPICGLAVMMFGVGVFWHFGSDMQKTVFLEMRQRFKAVDGGDKLFGTSLLKTKFWSYSRNPNYFGELLIYSSFCVLAWSWVPFVWLVCMVAGYWYPSMLKKERSLSRFGKEWQEYRDSSSFFIPYVY